MRKIVIFLVIFIFSYNFVNAADVNLYIFHSDSCPHCKTELSFLDSMQLKYPELNVYDFEVSKSTENVDKFISVAKRLNASANGVPFTVIGDEYFIGFREGTSEYLLESKIKECINNSCEDLTGDILGLHKDIESEYINQDASDVLSDDNYENSEKAEDQKFFSIPILGDIDAKTVSLPILTLTLGFVDGFNPCAMWVLLFLISLLLGMKNKKRRWILGSSFIIVSALVYFAFMALWLNLLLFFSYIKFIQIGIALVAIFGGLYGIINGLKQTTGCSVAGSDKKTKIINKMKQVVHQKSFWLALTGIIILAFSVNLIELVCSAGLPAVYTQVLAINNLSFVQYYLYISLYVLVFMLDDLIVFLLAMKTLEITGMTTKYSKITRVIGGIIMLIIGILLIFRPDLIMFG